MPDISINAADRRGSFSAYCAMPAASSGPGIVVLQEIFGVKNPLILHIAEKDGYCAPESQAKIKEALDPNEHVTVYSYPGVDHAFARVGGDNYDSAAAAATKGRTAELFRRTLV